MGELKDIKDGIKAAVVAAVSTGTAVKVGINPEEAAKTWSRYVVIIPEPATYNPNELIGSVSQWSGWGWGLFLYAGAAGTDEDAIDVMDALRAEVDAISGTRPTSACGFLEKTSDLLIVAYPNGNPLVKQTWRHEVNPTA